MSFVDKLRGELIDIIEWVDDSRTSLLWRYPRYHNQIKNGARLIVRPGQMAIFVHKGKLADVFDTGFHILKTENLPVLSTLQGWKHGFDSPFQAEVYFVSTRQVTELKWGTPNPVILRDPDFGPIRVRAFGAYTLRAKNPRALLTELVGTDSSFEADEISVLLRSIISSCFADVIAASGMSVVDLASNYASLSQELRSAVVARVDDEYGLDLPQLIIVNISLPEEVERALDARSSMGVIGDISRYQQYQLGRSIPVAAENPAGGLAAAGVGLGMGMSYAGQMLPGSGAGAVPPPMMHTTSAPVWHLAVGGKTQGPFSLAQLADAVAEGALTAGSMVWTRGMRDWTPAGEVTALSPLFSSPPPPPPVED